MEEFEFRIECPHCGKDFWEAICFNFMEADRSGCSSKLNEINCTECDKTFYFKGRVNFELEEVECHKRKPKHLLEEIGVGK